MIFEQRERSDAEKKLPEWLRDSLDRARSGINPMTGGPMPYDQAVGYVNAFLPEGDPGHMEDYVRPNCDHEMLVCPYAYYADKSIPELRQRAFAMSILAERNSNETQLLWDALEWLYTFDPQIIDTVEEKFKLDVHKRRFL